MLKSTNFLQRQQIILPVSVHKHKVSINLLMSYNRHNAPRKYKDTPTPPCKSRSLRLPLSCAATCALTCAQATRVSTASCRPRRSSRPAVLALAALAAARTAAAAKTAAAVVTAAAAMAAAAAAGAGAGGGWWWGWRARPARWPRRRRSGGGAGCLPRLGLRHLSVLRLGHQHPPRGRPGHHLLQPQDRVQSRLLDAICRSSTCFVG